MVAREEEMEDILEEVREEGPAGFLEREKVLTDRERAVKDKERVLADRERALKDRARIVGVKGRGNGGQAKGYLQEQFEKQAAYNAEYKERKLALMEQKLQFEKNKWSEKKELKQKKLNLLQAKIKSQQKR
jgi:hypothetical protein